MALSNWLLIFNLVMKINYVCVLSRCQESLSTVVIIKGCPRNKAEWESQSKRKECSKVSQSCVKPEEFLYHCLINEYMNMTIEVCAPSVIILGQKCAEFNIGGAIVQDSNYAKCNDTDPPCPFRYNSTDLYKYQRCYSYIKSTNNTQVLPNRPDDIRDKSMCSCDQNVWLAVSIVFIILLLISCGLGGMMLYKYRNLFHRTDDLKPEDIPLIAKGKDKDTDETDEEKSWVYSIYFGDKYCGMAYLNPEYPEDIISLGNHEIIGALVKKNGEVIEFGDKARKMFTDNEPGCSDYTFLDHDELNMEFWNDTISKLDSMKVIEIYQNIIGFLMKKIYSKITCNSKAQQEMSCESGSCMLCNMHCVITVPHHWDFEDRIKKLRAAFDRTMKDLHTNVKEERLHIKLREVAISPYIHEVKASVTCLNFNVDNLTFNEETTYVNLHVGSKYCSMTYLKFVSSQKPDEIIGKPNRQKWENTPEDLFVKLFEKLFTVSTKNIFYEWKTMYEREYKTLLCLLEDRKNKMRENMDDNEKYEFPLSSKLFEPFAKDESEMTHLRKRVTEEGGELEENACSLIFKWSSLKKYFSHVKERTEEIIQENKQNFKDRKIRCVIMTGSYSQMKIFLHEAEKMWFKDIGSPTVVIPVHIGSTYAMGAAYFFKKYPTWKSYDLINK